MAEPEVDEVEARVRADIATHGWHLALVPPEDDTPGWALTIGLFERFDHPEIVVFGPDIEAVARLAHHVASLVRDGRRFEAGCDAGDVLVDQRLGFRGVAPKWVAPFLGNAAWHYRSEGFPVLQCVWPDPGGHLPWEPGADPAWRDDQPLLHHQETHRALPERLVAVLRREGAL